MIVDHVFGAITGKLATYVLRKHIDEYFKRALLQKRQIIVYGSSGQGKTTLLNTHITYEQKITIQCSPSVNLSDIYKMILQKIDATIQSSSSNEDTDTHTTRFNFNIKLPIIAESEIEITSEKGNKSKTTEVELNISNAQDVAELLKKHFPNKIVILENFYCLDERVQKLFAFDLRIFLV